MSDVLARFHQALVEEIRSQRPEYLDGPFTVAEIYQNLVPYGSHRDRIGVEMNGDYEDALLRLLAGEGDYLVLESEPALRDLREELESSNPNTGLYREFAAADVRLNRDRLDPADATGPDPDDAPRGASYAGPPREQGDLMDVSDLAPHSPEDEGPTEPDDADEPSEPERDAEPAPVGARISLVTDGPSSGGSDDADGAGACRWCRAALPERENLNFCPFCGTDVHLVPCEACGEELEPEWRFCVACGTEAAG